MIGSGGSGRLWVRGPSCKLTGGTALIDGESFPPEARGPRARGKDCHASPLRTRGDVPVGVPALADRAFAELGLPALLQGRFEPAPAMTIRIRDNRMHLVLTSRLIPVNSIDAALLRAWTNPPKE